MKMKRRLVGWKRLCLSKGGQLTLIKSTPSNLSTYFLSLFPVLVCVANWLEKLQRDLLWGGLDNESKFHLVNWKKKGGGGVVFLFMLEISGLGVCLLSIRLFLESVYGDMM
jgi:hypothetical protein